MTVIFNAYDLPVVSLPGFYERLNRVITYPDGMTTSLGILYWGREAHLEGIRKAVPKLLASGLTGFDSAWQAMRTPAAARKLAEQTGIPNEILRVLKHDLDLWLPRAVPLVQLNWFGERPEHLRAFSDIGLKDQLALISAGQTQVQRAAISAHTNIKPAEVTEAVRYSDFYRTGKNLDHLRARIYYDMGLDTWQKWAAATSEEIIALFSAYIRDRQLEGERLIPWPKEIRNGIEWARLHLEIFAVQW